MEKETPDETYLKLVEIWKHKDFDPFKMCQDYHTERLKIEAPMDQEIKDLAKNHSLIMDRLWKKIQQ